MLSVMRVFHGRARVLVRSKLPEFSSLDEPQFETELDVTWQECLSNRGIEVSESDHIVKTKKTKCLVTDTVEEMTMCYKRDVVLRIWICKYGRNRPSRRPRVSDLLVEDRSLLSEDSAGEPEDSQDEGEGDGDVDEDPEDVYFRPPVVQRQALKDTLPLRRGSGRPRKIPARFLRTPSPDSRKPAPPKDNIFYSLSKDKRSTAIHGKSRKANSKLPNFSTKIALAPKKTNDELLSQLPLHVTKVQMPFKDAGKYLKPGEFMTPAHQLTNIQGFTEQTGNFQRESIKIYDGQSSGNGTAAPSSSQTIPTGISQVIDLVSKGLDAFDKRYLPTLAVPPKKRYFAGIDLSIPKKKSCNNEGIYPLGPADPCSSSSQWCPLDLSSSSGSRIEDSRSMSIIPNSKKWGTSVNYPSAGDMKELIKDRGINLSLGQPPAAALTSHAIPKSVAGVQKANTSSVLVNKAITINQIMSQEELSEMPILTVQSFPTSAEGCQPGKNAFLANTSEVDMSSNGYSKDVGKSMSTVTPVTATHGGVVKVSKLNPREEIPTCSRYIKLATKVHGTHQEPSLKDVKARNASMDISANNTRAPMVPPATVSPANEIEFAAPSRAYLLPKDKPDQYQSQDKKDESNSEKNDAPVKPVYHYWKRNKPSEKPQKPMD